MKLLLVLLAALLSLTTIHAAEPIVEVVPLPTGSELELYEDSEGLFALKLIEYYKAAVALETQLLMMGLQPDNRIAPPTLDDLQDMEIRTLRRYYSQALGVLKQVQNSPDGLYNKKIEELRAKLEKAHQDNFILKEQIHTQNLDLISSDFYKKRFRELVGQADSLRLLLDENYFDYMTKLWQHDENLRNIYENCANCTPILSLSMSGNFWDFRHDIVEADISPAVMVNFNPSPVLGFGRLIDIWGEYSYPILKTRRFNHNLDEIGIEYKTDFFTTGMNLNLPLSEVLKIDDFYLGLKAGYGFFWGNSRATNTNLNETNWNGQVVRLELNAANYNRFFFPLGVFITYNFYNYSKELRFPAFGNDINLGKPWVNNLQLGIKFSLWRSSTLLTNK